MEKTELVSGVVSSNANTVCASTEFVEVVTRRTRRGYVAASRGVDADGNAWESDDVGPFKTREEAREYVISLLHEVDL